MAGNHCIYIVSSEDLGTLDCIWKVWSEILRSHERGDSHIVSEDFSASHNEVNNLGALELCLKQLEVTCSLFVRIFVFRIKRFLLSLGRDHRGGFPFHQCPREMLPLVLY